MDPSSRWFSLPASLTCHPSTSTDPAGLCFCSCPQHTPHTLYPAVMPYNLKQISQASAQKPPCLPSHPEEDPKPSPGHRGSLPSWLLPVSLPPVLAPTTHPTTHPTLASRLCPLQGPGQLPFLVPSPRSLACPTQCRPHLGSSVVSSGSPSLHPALFILAPLTTVHCWLFCSAPRRPPLECELHRSKSLAAHLAPRGEHTCLLNMLKAYVHKVYFKEQIMSQCSLAIASPI